jgi:hypothetical protein
LGNTNVVGATGRLKPVVDSFGTMASFFGFLTILLLRCSPLGIA